MVAVVAVDTVVSRVIQNYTRTGGQMIAGVARVTECHKNSY